MSIKTDEEIILDEELTLEDEEMNDESIPDYILDIAKSSSYQNQTVEYYKDYSDWRLKKNNKYAYTYVKDVREKTYVDGKGFVSDGPDKAEKIALSNCFKLVSCLLIIPQIFTFLEDYIISKALGYDFKNLYYVGSTSYIINYSFSSVALSCIMHIIKMVVPIVLFFVITKIPKSVVLPKAKTSDYELSISAIAFILMGTIIGKSINLLLGQAFSFVGIGVTDFVLVDFSDVKSVLVYAFCEYIIMSILVEVLFRGIILQLFRQFGDMFALLVSCITNVLFFNDVTLIGYLTLTTVIIGLFTLRSGSIYTAIAMRISARLVVMVISICRFYIGEDIALWVEIIVSIVIISFALVVYSRMISKKLCDFNVTDSYTHLSTKTKFVVMFSTTTVIVWLVLTLVLMIFSVRFV
ncbi:MAG: CPBP family intramembrane metalloprotease [Ruminococcus sp.]|nr:CPBP family intramembrane metalloprotease [Ruminococcus sp.]